LDIQYKKITEFLNYGKRKFPLKELILSSLEVRDDLDFFIFLKNLKNKIYEIFLSIFSDKKNN